MRSKVPAGIIWVTKVAKTIMKNNKTTECGNSLKKEDLKIKDSKFN
tara:strand:+ start:1019 stop:1156 length:138 start_codon:yes stop_codon:yes gene_type:complete